MKKIHIYIIILFCIILTFSIINSYKYIHTETLIKNKGLLLLYGESFREGGQGNRTKDTPNSLIIQKIASDSHVSFCDHLKSKYNIYMDVMLNTYDTKYENELKGWYVNVPIIDYISYSELIGPEKLINNALKKIDQSKYDFVLFTRMDIAFKPYFLELFNPEWNKIMFASSSPISISDTFHSHIKNLGYPSVNPIISFVPQNHFDILQNMDIDHSAWKTNYELFNKRNNDMDYITDTYFEANTSRNINPIYYMVSRDENTQKEFDETNVKIDKSWYKQ